MKYLTAILLVFLLIILGDSYGKIAVGIAALIFLGTLILHSDSLKTITGGK